MTKFFGVSRPTLDYDRLYGATKGPWTTGLFVEAAYGSLIQSGKYPQAHARIAGI
ncbi:MAG TPA: hypothetical protein VLM42_10705 [Bryobacteraceae bacterium]|nr:hypothetical protein [Bryobacteraceae bacterium]